ncbi:MAG: cytidylate kinase-like family protein [Clostridiales bacterium]|nr:cytidylate kinase-like family protein [Clostridiales bacterium]
MRKSKYVITVQRQFGSLGRPIAKRMAEILGIEYYDRDIVDKAAEQLNLPASVVKSEEETAAAIKNPFSNMRFPLGKSSSSMQNKIFEAQQNIIKFLAEKETCVIVGRCADFTLSEMENAVHIYIYAPYEERLKHCINDLGLEETEAKKMICEVDEARDSYHKNFAGFLPDDKAHKDILIDSSFLGIEGTAEYLVEAVKRKFPEKQ